MAIREHRGPGRLFGRHERGFAASASPGTCAGRPRRSVPRASAAVPGRRYARPKLSDSVYSRPGISLARCRASSTRFTTRASSVRVISVASTANSSPPIRATRSARRNDLVLEQFGDFAQGAVPGFVPEVVVDVLEAVEVGEHEPQSVARSERRAQLLIGERREAAPVEQSRQIIGEGEPSNGFDHLAALADVPKHNQTAGLAPSPVPDFGDPNVEPAVRGR